MARYKQIDMSSRFLAVDLSRQILPGSFEFTLIPSHRSAEFVRLRVTLS